MRNFRKPLALVSLAAMLLLVSSVPAVRIKDVTHIEGIRENQLIGYGLVVGLMGTGDGSQTQFTVTSLVSYLRRSGITISADQVKVKNVAAVIVTVNLPPFARTGQQLDVTVSSIGDAASLAGGTLLMTPLKGPDGEVYAVAQGSVSVGGYSASAAGSGTTKNQTTSGGVPGGGLVEKVPPTKLEGRKQITLVLENPDFTTAERISEVINQEIQGARAKAVDSASVSVSIPPGYSTDLTAFVSQVEGLPIHPDQRARIVLDERNGTIVMGQEVRIATLALTHGNLTIQVKQSNDVSQPAPFSSGKTAQVSNATVKASEEKGQMTILNEGVSLGEIVASINAIGVTPRDLISILQSIKASGALQAELVIR